MSQRSSLAAWTQAATAKHYNYYDYSEAVYRGSDSKITIICPIHGKFEQTAGSHLKGHGCAACSYQQRGRQKSLTLSQFVEKSQLIHGVTYDYSLVTFVNILTKVKIICPIHGEFEILPKFHLAGHGCQQCGKINKSNKLRASTQDFIQKSHQIHDHKYHYHHVNYVTSKHKVTITCPLHGNFNQVAGDHLAGYGCPKCAKLYRPTTAEFIASAQLIHQFKYDYSLVNYQSSKIKIPIICSVHGTFWQTPHAHIIGKCGCPNCSNWSSKKEQAWIQSLNNPNLKLQQTIKINNRIFKVDGFDPTTNTIYEFYGDFWHGNPQVYSAEAVNCINKKKFGELYLATLEKENILKNHYHLVHIWEYDWDLLTKT
jgi:hypothetical protein